MRRVLVTGAGGYVGQALVRRLLAPDAGLAAPLARLTAIDQHFGPDSADWRQDPRVHCHVGDFGDAALLDAALAVAPDLVFHLASVPGSRAEQSPALGLQVNLLAPIALLQRLAAPATERAARRPPRVVFASSVAVYGDAATAAHGLHEDQPARPCLSYGTHKRMTELLLADFTRRGELDGVSLRLPGIVARPPSASGHGSAFMSELIRRLWAGQPFVCPVSAAARAWWMSLPTCLDNLLHAADLPVDRAPASMQAVQLPVLTASMQALVAEIELLTGRPAEVRWQPDERLEALFGRQPPLFTPRARALGFTDDGSLAQLVRRAVAEPACLNFPFTHKETA